jgi:hypothetical protein
MLAHSRCDIGSAHDLLEKLSRQQAAALLGAELSDETRRRLQQAFDRCAPVVKGQSSLHSADQLRRAVLEAGVAPFGFTMSKETFAEVSDSGCVSFDGFCAAVRRHRAGQGALEACVAAVTERIAGWTALRRCMEASTDALAAAPCVRQAGGGIGGGGSGDERRGEASHTRSDGSRSEAGVTPQRSTRSAAEQLALMSDAYVDASTATSADASAATSTGGESGGGESGGGAGRPSERVLHASRRGAAPSITLDPRYYTDAEALTRLLPCGPPSLLRCTSLTVVGRVTIGNDVALEGDVKVINRSDCVRELPSGVYMDEELEL